LVPSCQEAGVLGALAGVIGLIQATETLKLILGIGEPLVGKFLLFDALEMNLMKLNVRRNEDCPVCGENPTIQELIDYERFCGSSASVRLAAHEADL
jgi:adenylyltransferase/sulfurtransferase